MAAPELTGAVVTNERVWIGRVVICLGVVAAIAPHAGAQVLPAPWVNTDIGNPNVAGGASASGRLPITRR